MKGYSERCVFLPSVIRLHTLLSKVIDQFDSNSSTINLGESRNELRCHELARAVKRFMTHGNFPYHLHPANVTLLDGKYGLVDHSWLELFCKSPEGLCSLYILDVYAVGQLPQVQLLDTTFQLPHRANYKPGARRDDINMRIVNLVFLDFMSIASKYSIPNSSGLNHDAVGILAPTKEDCD